MANSPQTEQNCGSNLINLLRDLIFEHNSNNCWQKLNAVQQQDTLRLAVQTGLGPLAYYYFRQNNIILNDNAPVNNQLFLTGTAMALQRQTQLKNLITLLEQEKIETVILKGAWTAEILYPHPALRTMHDIDILLMPKDEDTAYKIIKANGYVPYAGEYDGSKHLPSLVPLNNRGLAVELHHDISNRSDRFTAERLWKYSEPREIAGIKSRVFIPEMLFLHHCLHMIEEYFGNGIKNITETAFIVDRKLFDAEKLFKLADELELSATLALSLAVAERLFRIKILPMSMSGKLPQVPHAVLNNACHLICSNNSKVDETSAMLSRECSKRNFFSKIGFLLKRTFRPPAQIAGMYDCSKYSPKLPFYYLHRILKYAASVPEVWRTEQQTGKNSTAYEIGQYQRKIIDFCKIDNYHG